MTLYTVLQAMKDGNTAGVYGTYLDRKAAERAIEQAKGPAYPTAHQEARYFIQEGEAEEIGAKQEAKPGGGPAKPEEAAVIEPAGEPPDVDPYPHKRKRHY